MGSAVEVGGGIGVAVGSDPDQERLKLFANTPAGWATRWFVAACVLIAVVALGSRGR